MREHVLHELRARGVGVGADCIAATGRNAADPHYAASGGARRSARRPRAARPVEPQPRTRCTRIRRGWRISGGDVPERAAKLFAVIRDARDAAVEFLQDRLVRGRSDRGPARSTT
jgi:Xaa-Pro aminopeptidase